MAQTELSILITLKDQATQALQKFSGSLGGTFDDAKKASYAVAGALAVVATGAVAFGVSAVKAASEAQAEMSQFDAMLKNTKGSTEDAKNKMLEAAQAAVKLGFDDETAALSMAKFYQRTGDVTEAIKLNTLAMDLSRNKHVDMNTAVNMVNMALSGQGRALLAYGIQLKEAATPLEALKQLQDLTKGSAEAFASTYEGKMQAFHESFTNFKEMVGEKIIPILTKFLDALTPVLTMFMEWASNLNNLNTFFNDHYVLITIIAGGIVGMLIPSLIALGTTIWVTVIPAFIAAAVAMAPFLITGLIIGGVVAGIIWVVKNWTMLKENAILLFTAIKDFFAKIWNDITNIFKSAIDYLMKLIQPFINAVDRVVSGAKSIGATVGKGISSAVSSVGNFLGINDGIVQNGQIITTHPDDFIIATKNPNKLGGGVSVNIVGGTYLSEDAAYKLGDMIIKKLQMQFSI